MFLGEVKVHSSEGKLRNFRSS